MRQEGLLQVLRVWRRHVVAVDADGRVVEVVEAALADLRHDLAGHAGKGPALVDDDDAAGLLHALDDAVDVEGADRAHIEHVRVNALLLELVGGLKAEVHRAAEGDERHVIALAAQVGLPEGDVVLLGRDVGLVAQHALALEEEDGIELAQGGLEEALGVVGVAGNGDLDAGNVAVKALDAP